MRLQRLHITKTLTAMRSAFRAGQHEVARAHAESLLQEIPSTAHTAATIARVRTLLNDARPALRADGFGTLEMYVGDHARATATSTTAPRCAPFAFDIYSTPLTLMAHAGPSLVRHCSIEEKQQALALFQEWRNALRLALRMRCEQLGLRVDGQSWAYRAGPEILPVQIRFRAESGAPIVIDTATPPQNARAAGEMIVHGCYHRVNKQLSLENRWTKTFATTLQQYCARQSQVPWKKIIARECQTDFDSVSRWLAGHRLPQPETVTNIALTLALYFDEPAESIEDCLAQSRNIQAGLASPTGGAIRRILREFNIAQITLARGAGVSQNFTSNWICGLRFPSTLARLKVVWALANLTGRDVAELWDEIHRDDFHPRPLPVIAAPGVALPLGNVPMRVLELADGMKIRL